MYKRVNATLWACGLAWAMACGPGGGGSSTGSATGKTTSPFGSLATGTQGSQSAAAGSSGALANTAGSSGAVASAAMGSSGGSSLSTTGGTSGGAIPPPGPGDNADNAFDSVPPNGTPAQATPLGTAMTGDVYAWVDGNSIGGTEASNYFVFETGPSAGNFTLGSSGFCWSGGITQLNATLWQVSSSDQQIQPPVHTWMGTPGSNGCLMSMMGDAPTLPSTVYLLGVTATGGSGMYQA